MVLHRQSGSSDEGASVAPHQPTQANPEGTQSEREEALWCQVVLLRERISRMEKDLMLRDELIGLLREQTTRLPPAIVIPKGYHKCGWEPCQEIIDEKKRYCSRRHAALNRWVRTPENEKPT